ncbi:ubiquitin-protein ligase E3 A [Nematocida sp. AWRm77]|nr:ubiquitin-protein ligase E3 A [Nematocida sp. AWRm77]
MGNRKKVLGTKEAIKEELKTQLVYGCEEGTCVGIFCKVADVEPFVGDVIRLLSEYNSYFLCQSLYFVHKKVLHNLKKEEKIEQQFSLHKNFSTNHLPLHKQKYKKYSHSRYSERKEMLESAKSVLEYLYRDMVADSGVSLSVPNSPYMASAVHTSLEDPQKEVLLFELARIVHQKRAQTTSIMLQALFYHELNKIKQVYKDSSVVRLVKLFNAVKETVKFEKKYFLRFLSAIQKMCYIASISNIVCMERCNRMAGGPNYKKETECGFYEEEEFPVPGSLQKIAYPESTRVIEECVMCRGSFAECEYPQCDHLCLLSEKLCVNELIDLIKSLSIVIDNTSMVNLREGTLLITILKTLKALYELAVKTGVIHHSIFINKRFSRLLNCKLEIRYHKEGAPSILDYPFILDMAGKSELIHIENTTRMKSELQASFFRSLFEGKIVPPYLRFEIRRETVVEDSAELLQKLGEGTKWRQLKIKFAGEDGVDAGGVKKEFFQILSQKILEQWDIFEEKNGTLWLKRYAHEDLCARESLYYLLGCILGLAAYNNSVLCFHFPNIFYKRLLGHISIFEDLKQIDPSLYTSLSQLKTMSAEEISTLDLEFPPGTVHGSTCVSKDNISAFIREYHRDVLETSVEPAFGQIRQGFWSICGDTFIKSLLPCELSVLIGGIECHNLEEIEQYTTYTGYSRDSLLVQYFWEVFKEYDSTMQKKLLRFVTGSDRAPSGGVSKIALVLMRNGGDTDSLPSSHTCFNTLLIPEYTTKDKLKTKLDTAITFTEGFFLL